MEVRRVNYLASCSRSSISKTEREQRDLFKKSTLYVARVGKNENDELEFRMSKPCSVCIDFMMMVGIDKICYTTGTSEVYRIVKLGELAAEPRFVSAGTRIYYRIPEKKRSQLEDDTTTHQPKKSP